MKFSLTNSTITTHQLNLNKDLVSLNPANFTKISGTRNNFSIIDQKQIIKQFKKISTIIGKIIEQNGNLLIIHEIPTDSQIGTIENKTFFYRSRYKKKRKNRLEHFRQLRNKLNFESEQKKKEEKKEKQIQFIQTLPFINNFDSYKSAFIHIKQTLITRWNPGSLSNRKSKFKITSPPSLVIILASQNTTNFKHLKNELKLLKIPSLIIMDHSINPNNFYYQLLMNTQTHFSKILILQTLKQIIIKNYALNLLKFKNTY